ncbi:LptF/LptG family permease, partial [Bowmanella dokdonensis]
YVDNEMAVMRACGISEWYVTRVMLVLAVLVAAVSGALTLWLAPLSMEVEYQLEEKISAESGLTSLIPGRFQQTANQKAVIFVHDIGSGDNQLER